MIAAARHRLDLPQLQRAARPRGRAATTSRRWSCAPGRGDRRPRLLRQGRDALEDPEVGRGRLRRRGRRAQHRLVGGVGGAGLVRPPLRGARRRRPARVLLGLERGAPLRAHRRGRHASTASCSCSPPWAVRNIRFDEALGRFHGYDFDFCLQVREAGRKVVTADLRAIHHHRSSAVRDLGQWIEAHMRVAEKWDGRMPGVGQDAGHLGGACAPGRGRARRRRADRSHEAARAPRRGVQRARARAGGDTGSISWRLTAPLAPAGRRARDRRSALGHHATRRPTGATPGPGIRLAAEPDSEVYAFAAVGSICRSYNLLLDRAARATTSRRSSSCTRTPRSLDPRLLRRGRGALSSDPDVARRRAAPGARDVQHDRLVGGRRQRGPGHPALPGVRRRRAAGVRVGGPGSPPGEVDAVDGFLMVLSPWARAQRCASTSRSSWATATTSTSASRSRAAGRKVVTADLPVAYPPRGP